MKLENAFINKIAEPTDDELAAVLGRSKAVWDQLLAELAQEHNLGAREWNSYSRKAGWSLRLKSGQRNIVYLSPCRGCFLVSFALGAKAVQWARQSGLPQRVLKIIDEAKTYAEGTAVRIKANNPKDIAVIKKLTNAKLNN
jgi:hypothetical protein